MKLKKDISDVFRRVGAGLTAAIVAFNVGVSLDTLKANAAGSTSLSSLKSNLGIALDYSVFAREFTSGSDMEGNVAVENAYFSNQDATNSNKNYELFENNTIDVVISGTEGQSVTFALFTKSGSNYDMVSGTKETVTIPDGESSVTHTYYHSDVLPLYQTNKYYLACVDASGSITDINNVEEISVDNGVSNVCYIGNLKTVGGNFTRESFDDLVICLNSSAYDKLTWDYNNGNGVTIFADDGTKVEYNHKLNIKKIGRDVAQINFDYQFNKLKNYSVKLSELDSDSKDVKIINITADELLNSYPMLDIELKSGEYAVLNIDADSDTYTTDNPLTLAYTINGVGDDSQWNLLASRVLTNIYDSTESDNIFTGAAVCNPNHGTMGTILMPGGIYYSRAGNTNGGVIAQKVYLEAGEIHKIPFGIDLTATCEVYLTANSTPAPEKEYDVSFTKSAENGTTVLKGAVFALYSDFNCETVVEIASSDSNGKVTFSDLTAGTYYVKETIAPDGYEENTTKYTLVVKDDGAITLSDNNSGTIINKGSGGYYIKNTKITVPYYTLTVKKTDGTNTLAGAGFTLYSDSTCKTQIGSEQKTNASGSTTFENLAAGTYYLKETTVPDGYKSDNSVRTVVISDADKTVYITNEIIKHTFSFNKVDDNSNALSGAKFTLYSESACKNVVNTAISDSNGKVTFSDIVAGTYYLKETVAPTGYKSNNTLYTVVVTNNGTVTADGKAISSFTVKNTLIKVDLAFTKVDDSSKALAGAKFTLYSDSDCTKTVASYTTAADGKVTFSDLKVGTYYMKETTVPDGYKANANKYTIIVDSNGAFTISESVAGTLVKDSSGNYSIKNTKAEVPVYKFTVKKTDGTNALSGAGFTLYTNADCTSAYSVEYKTATNGIITFANLKSGTYYLKETTVPTGYKGSNMVYKVVVATDGKITVNNIAVTGSYTVVNPIIPKYDLTFTKTSEDGKPLTGAVFTLYTKSDCKTAIGNGASDSNGMVTFSDLVAGTYYMKETTVPDGYKANARIYTITVGSDGAVTISESDSGTLVNNAGKYSIKNIKVVIPVYKLTVQKTDGTNPLSGAGFTLYTNSACTNAVGSEQLTANGTTTFANLKAGKYYLKETTVPVGYTSDDKVYEVVISDSDKIIIVKNAIIKRTFTFTKTTEDSKPLVGAEFTLYSDYNCTKKVATCVSTSDGKVTFPDLVVGKYYMVETKVPAGYKENSKIYTVAVTKNGDITVDGNSVASGYTVVNKIIPKFDFTFTNTTEDGKTPLPGSEFTIYTDSTCKTEVQKSTSDSNGKVTFTDLTEGKYYMQETKTPDGYRENNTTYTVEITENGEITISANTTGTLIKGENGYIIQGTSDKEPAAKYAEINLIKTYTSEHLSTPSLLNETKFTLYDNAGLTVNSNTLTASPVWKTDKAVVSFVVPTPESGNATWYLKETEAPLGYNIAKNVYECNISADGTVKYRVYGSNTVLSADFPVCDNEKHIVLIKRYDNAALSTEEILSATEFTLYRNYDGTVLSGKIATATPKWDSKRGMAVVSFKNLTAPDSGYVIHYLKETASPVDYSTSETVYECMIDSDCNVSYRIYGTSGAFSETFPICNNLKIYDPVVPEEGEDGKGGEEGSDSSNPNGGSDSSDSNGSGSSGSNGGNNSENDGEDGKNVSGSENPDTGVSVPVMLATVIAFGAVAFPRKKRS